MYVRYVYVTGPSVEHASSYSPSTVTTKRAPPRPAAPAPAEPEPTPAEPEPTPGPAPAPVPELPDAYRPGEWLTAVSPRKAPYHPQMGDECLYFRLVSIIYTPCRGAHVKPLVLRLISPVVSDCRPLDYERNTECTCACTHTRCTIISPA